MTCPRSVERRTIMSTKHVCGANTTVHTRTLRMFSVAHLSFFLSFFSYFFFFANYALRFCQENAGCKDNSGFAFFYFFFQSSLSKTKFHKCHKAQILVTTTQLVYFIFPMRCDRFCASTNLSVLPPIEATQPMPMPQNRSSCPSHLTTPTRVTMLPHFVVPAYMASLITSPNKHAASPPQTTPQGPPQNPLQQKQLCVTTSSPTRRDADCTPPRDGLLQHAQLSSSHSMKKSFGASFSSTVGIAQRAQLPCIHHDEAARQKLC